RQRTVANTDCLVMNELPQPTASRTSARLSSPMRLGTSIMNVLVIDIGGTNVKILATGQQEPVKFPSGPAMTAKAMVAGVKTRTRDWKYDVISVGYPGPVLRGCPKAEPRNLATGWVGFDFEAAFERPVKLIT